MNETFSIEETFLVSSVWWRKDCSFPSNFCLKTLEFSISFLREKNEENKVVFRLHFLENGLKVFHPFSFSAPPTIAFINFYLRSYNYEKCSKGFFFALSNANLWQKRSMTTKGWKFFTLFVCVSKDQKLFFSSTSHFLSFFRFYFFHLVHERSWRSQF